MSGKPSRWHTILSDGKRPEVEEDLAERRKIEQHVGRFIVGWGYVDYSLSIATAAWANPSRPGQLQPVLFEQGLSAKIAMLEALLPDDWRDGQSLIFHLKEGNAYRNRIAHYSLAMSGQDGETAFSWHFWKESGGKTKRLEINPELVVEQNLKMEVLREAVHALLRGTYLGNAGDLNEKSLAHSICMAPGMWETRENFDAFQAKVHSMFPG